MSTFWSEYNSIPELEGENQNGPTVLPLRSHTLIEIKGQDSAKFMQGQFTCDLNSISVNQSSLGACCSVKGRVIAMFRLSKLADDHYLMKLPSDIVEKFISHLSKYKVFFKCEISILEDWGVLGLCGDQEVVSHFFDNLPHQVNDAILAENQLVIRVPGPQPRFEFWTNSTSLKKFFQKHSHQLNIANSGIWEVMEVKAGLGEVYSDTSETFIPQMLNMQALGGVDFDKGCYTGQEIVARMQYLGKLKKRMFLLASNGINISPGATVYDSQSNSAGTVVRSAQSTQDQSYLLAVIDIESAKENESFNIATTRDSSEVDGESLGIRATVRELPYPVDQISNTRTKV